MAYFVKFVPYNKNTLSSLINKTIKFSTVYEFNDFNEFHFIAPHYVPGGYDEILEKIYEIFQCISLRANLINSARERPYKKNFINELQEFISYGYDERENYKKFWGCLLEHAVFSSVGIFCLSDVSTFETDSAQLMFAHYADNLKGLALIYNVDSGLKKVSYNDQKPPSGETDKDIINWIEGKFDNTDMNNFLAKSDKWKYENEYRLFKKPGIYEAERCSVHLMAILHTLRLKEEDIETLKAINLSIYKNNIQIKAIIPSYENYHFMVEIQDKLSPLHMWVEALN